MNNHCRKFCFTRFAISLRVRALSSALLLFYYYFLLAFYSFCVFEKIVVIAGCLNWQHSLWICVYV